MTLPSNLEYERSALCAFIFEPELRYQIHDLDDLDFFFPENGEIFRCIKILISRDQEPGITQIMNLLLADNKPAIIKILTAFSNQYLSSTYLLEIIAELKKLSRFRSAARLIDSKRPIFNQTNAKTQGEFEKLTNDLRKLVFDYKAEEFDTTEDYATKGYDNPIRTIVAEAQLKQERKARGETIFAGHPTHFLDIDKHFDGFLPGHLTIIGARPAVGKTTFAINLALKMAMINKLKVGFFSLEMMGLEVTELIHCIHAGISHRKLKKGEITGIEFQKFNAAFHELKANPIRLDSRSNLQLSKLSHKIKAWIELYGLQIVFIDYLQLITPSDASRSKYEQVTEISQTLKVLAKECNIPIVSLAQVNRESTQTLKSERPKASQLRDSGSLEQDADEIFLLHSEKELPSTLEVMLVKNRFGSTGDVKLHFNKETGVISNLAPLNERPHESSYFSEKRPYYDDSNAP